MQTGQLVSDKIDSQPLQPPLTWRQRITPWWQAVCAVWPLFLLSRILFLALTYLGTVLFTVSNYSSNVLPASTLFYSWYRWDTVRFASIAANGYGSLEYTAFFPLYPLFMRLTSVVLGRDVFLAGLLISNLAFLGLLVVLYRLVEYEFDGETAKRAGLYLTFFPTAFFFFAAYNESLFLLWMALAIYAARRGNWWLTGLWGGLATLTRSSGLVLVIFFLFEFGRQHWQYRTLLMQMVREKQFRALAKHLRGLAALLFFPLGLGIYALYLHIRFQDALAFVHAQALWRHGFTWPWDAVILVVQALQSAPPFSFAVLHTWIDLSFLLVFLVLLLLCFIGPERFPRHLWSLPLVGLLMLIYPLCFPGLYHTPLISVERFVIELLAGFILLARLGRRAWFHQWYLIITLPFLAFLLVQFVTNHWTV